MTTDTEAPPLAGTPAATDEVEKSDADEVASADTAVVESDVEQPEPAEADTEQSDSAAPEAETGGDSGAGETPPPAVADRPRRRWPWVVVGTVVFALLVTAGAIAGGTMSYAASLEDRLLPGTSIAGVDVSGMTRNQALAAVRAEIAPQLRRTVTVRWRDQEWSSTVRKLGGYSDADEVVDRVAAEQSGLEWADWARLRWLDESRGVAADISIGHRRAPVRRFVKRIAADVERDPVDAELEVHGDAITVTPHAIGYRVPRKKAVAAVMERLQGETSPVQLDVAGVAPATTEAAFDQVLLLDQGDHRLTLFLGGEKARSWIVATGTGDYPTPLGRYSITLKRYMPTWVNPAPDGWGKSMPAEIAPGVNNPLGVRALNWDAPAIRFHGTQAIDSLGTDASHGCVRMSNKDVTELYDLVDVGAVIVSQA